MGISLADLKEAMAPLSGIGKGELSFEVMGVTISLRTLTPDEEIEVQRYSRAVLAEGDLTDQVNALEYLDRFRIGSLGYSIVQIGELDFRDLETIETGEMLPNGMSVKLKRHEAVQRLVGEWSRNMVVAVFKKFGELMNKVEKEVENLIDFEPVDYDAEITRLEERLRELRDEKVRMKASEKDSRTNVRNEVISASGSFRGGDFKSPISPDGASPPQNLSQEQMRTPDESTTVVVPSDIDREISTVDSDESHAPDGETLEATPETSTPQTRVSVFERTEGRIPPPTQTPPLSYGDEIDSVDPVLEDPLADVRSSMVDMSDPEAAEKAVEEENRRLQDMRSKALRGRTPPHLGAKQVAQEQQAQDQAIQQPSFVGTKDGVEVYKMPTQTITDRGRSPTPAQTPVRGGNMNPRFKPTKS